MPDTKEIMMGHWPAHLRIFGQFMNEQCGIEQHEAATHYQVSAGLPTSEQISTLLEKHSIVVSQQDAISLGQEADAKLENAGASVVISELSELPPLLL